MPLDLQNLDPTSRKVIELRKHLADGRSVSWIRRHMRLTRSQYEHLRKRAGTTRPSGAPKKVVDAKIEPLYNTYEASKGEPNAVTIADISDWTGIPERTLYRRFKQFRERRENESE